MQVGDKVIVREDLKLYNSYGNFVVIPEMLAFLGKEVTVKKVHRRCIEIVEDAFELSWGIEMFEGYETIVLKKATLQRWAEMLSIDGANTKGMVRNDICKVLSANDQ